VCGMMVEGKKGVGWLDIGRLAAGAKCLFCFAVLGAPLEGIWVQPELQLAALELGGRISITRRQVIDEKICAAQIGTEFPRK